MLKIIAGEYRSRRLEGPAVHDRTTRPYLQRVKESVFNVLREWFEDARVLDLFAGVGTVGLEAVSRGAAEVVMVERSQPLVEILKRNIEMLDCAERARVWRGDALAPECLRQAPSPLDLVFVDPPFAIMEDAAGRQRVLEQIARCRSIMAAPSFLVLRSPLGPDEVGLDVPGFEGPEPHRYGKGMWVLFYHRRDGTPGDGGATAG